ncbi:hypothetical protein [Maledivibacter halophilus]|uniref:PrgI family protein n=1 Tax=Maledivibacter halophilus TaxID=36842 RepID=A0A1T5LQ99_9FIRM|nr:hypothetical protein [Maledivibacter halophilus]SKC77729.1 hypothetical protein SAMN02194393_03176 [Maledivibacter halophilus]
MKNDKPLYIPQGLKLRKEIVNGFGKEEVIKTTLITIIAGFIDILLFILFRNTVVTIVFMLISISGSVMMLTKDISNVSVVDQIGFLLKYALSQKKYRYKYKLERKDEYGKKHRKI